MLDQRLAARIKEHTLNPGVVGGIEVVWGNYVDLITNPHKSLTFGGDERIRTSDQSFSPDAPLAGECLRPARPRLRIDAITTPYSLTDSVKQRDLLRF